MTQSIEGALTDARALGMQVCPEATTALHAVPETGDRLDCVPYGALAALAGDHANTATELEESLSVPVSRPFPLPDAPVALMLADAAQAVWRDFQTSAPTEVVRIWTMSVKGLSSGMTRPPNVVSPRDYVRALDAQLLAIDPGYVTRAKNAKTHFHDDTSSMDQTVRQAVAGDVDNALAQMLSHHARSLQLAVRSRLAADAYAVHALRAEALLEHAFALHFMEDGFAAGHIATDPGVTDPEKRAQRHDFFNRQGLGVTRAVSSQRCQESVAFTHRDMGLPLCWTAHGDGFASADDRLFVGEAVARLQTAFAAALDGLAPQIAQLESDACRSWVQNSAEPEGCDAAVAAILLDPGPWWSKWQEKPGEPDNKTWARGVLTAFDKELNSLATSTALIPADAGRAQPQLGVLSDEVLHWASLWRATLSAWPGSQTDITTLDGADLFGHGLNLQILASAAGSYAAPFADRTAIYAWGGVGTGVAYSAQGVFPHRKTKALLELNGGVAEGLLLAGTGPRFRTLLVLEARVPATTLLLYAAAMLWRTRGPLTLVGDQTTVGILGGRAYFAMDGEQLLFTGWDLEVLNAVLGNTDQATQAARSGLLETELRLRFGVRAPDVTVPLHGLFDGAFAMALEVNSGFFTALLK